MLFHGDPDKEACVGVQANAANYTAVIDRYFNDFKGEGNHCTDSQAYLDGIINYWQGYDADGPHKLVNNFIESAGEGVQPGTPDYDYSAKSLEPVERTRPITQHPGDL